MTKEKVIELIKEWCNSHIAIELEHSNNLDNFNAFEESVKIELEEVLRYLNDH